MLRYLFLLGVLTSLHTSAQFNGHAGIYFLGTADIPIGNSNYANPNINGVVVRFKWNSVEPTPGNFNWSFVDAEIAKAQSNNKKVSLQPIGKPNWLDSIGAKKYYYIEKSQFSPSFGKVVSEILPWDTTYVNRYKIFLKNLAAKYANTPIVTYINAVGVNFSRGLPDTVVIDTNTLAKKTFWTAYNYNADTLGKIMNQITDYYMGLFPTTPMWCSVDYVTFQPNASGQARNYLATIYCNYGITKYSNRFGLFREDVSGCNPNLAGINSGSHWYILKQNPCRTGGQMLWNVQDGPARMNQCGILPNTKAVVFDSAVNKGLALGMRYLEIYGIDIIDASLTNSMQQANNKLMAKGNACNSILPIILTNFSGECNDNSVTIKWTTSSENNCRLFNIERSFDGNLWKKISTKSGLDQSSQNKSYTFIDNNAVENKYYYRIQILDFNNNRYFSNILTINNCKNNFNRITIYPNPANDLITLSLGINRAKQGNYVIINSLGFVVKEIFLTNSTQINIANLPSGIYFLKSKEKTNQSFKFIKK